MITATPRPLIIAAAEFEIAPLRAASTDLECHLLLSGIGSVNSALTVAVWLEKHRRQTNCAIFIGSCGSYLLDRKSSFPIGSALACTRVALGDAAQAEHRGYMPELMVREHHADPELVRISQAIGTVPAIFASTATITKDELLASAIASATGAQVENLELFGVAAACAKFDLPWTALSLVTNQVGPNAHSEWASNFAQVADKSAQLVMRLLPHLLHHS